MYVPITKVFQSASSVAEVAVGMRIGALRLRGMAGRCNSGRRRGLGSGDHLTGMELGQLPDGHDDRGREQEEAPAGAVVSLSPALEP